MMTDQHADTPLDQDAGGSDYEEVHDVSPAGNNKLHGLWLSPNSRQQHRGSFSTPRRRKRLRLGESCSRRCIDANMELVFLGWWLLFTH